MHPESLQTRTGSGPSRLILTARRFRFFRRGLPEEDIFPLREVQHPPVPRASEYPAFGREWLCALDLLDALRLAGAPGGGRGLSDRMLALEPGGGMVGRSPTTGERNPVWRVGHSLHR
jgi:hypothetical protein